MLKSENPTRGDEIPDYETYDFRQAWAGRGIEDLAERRLVSKWGEPGGEAALAELIETGVAPNRLMLVYERDNVPTRIRKAAEKSGALVNCLRPFDNQVPDYALAFARARGRKLGAGSADFLAARHAGDLAAIRVGRDFRIPEHAIKVQLAAVPVTANTEPEG